MARFKRAIPVKRASGAQESLDGPVMPGHDIVEKRHPFLCHGPLQAGHPEKRAMSLSYYVYIMASARNGTLYIGMTSDLARRAFEHREGMIQGFTGRYGVKTLVYYETFNDVHDAIHRETRLKKWKRRWKLELIESLNREWRDLYLDLNN